MQSDRNYLSDFREELNEFDLDADFFQKIKSLAEKTKTKLENTFSLLEQKKLILNAIKSIPLKHFPENPLTLEDPKELTYFYFFQILQEPILQHCKSISDVEDIFDPIINIQKSLMKEIQNLLAQKPNRHLSNEKKLYVRQLKNDLHYAALNQQAQTFTLSEHAHLNTRLQKKIDDYKNQLSALQTLGDQEFNQKIAQDQTQDLKSSYQSTKSFFGEKHFCANYISHHLGKKLSTPPKDKNNQELNQLLNLEKDASEGARKQFHFFGNKQSRLEKWIGLKSNEHHTNTDLSAMTFGNGINFYLSQLLQKTYFIERSFGYKLKRFFQPHAYKQEQLCMLKIRDFVYACVKAGIDRPDKIQKKFDTYKLAIQTIQNAHPSLIQAFNSIIEINKKNREENKIKMRGLENPESYLTYPDISLNT